MESRRNFEARRALVYRLLKEGTGEKMLANRSANAVATLRLAYQKARDPEDLYPPLLQATAYRLANALFRSARSKDQLCKVKGLLVEATSDERCALGPMPHIHRVAVLRRLKEIDPLDETYDVEALAAYETACRLARSDEASVAHSKRTIVESRIQGQMHNLLELTAYFTGFEYERRADGLFSPFEDLRLEDGWKIVGTDGVNEAVRYPQDLAEWELDARKAAGVDLLFRLGPPTPRSTHAVWTPRTREKRYSSPALLMLVELCRHPCSDEDLFRAVYGDADFDRQKVADGKRDLRALLSERIGEAWEQLLPKVDSGEPLKLTPSLRVAGMVATGGDRSGA